MPVWLSLLRRVGLVIALIGIALAGHWFDRAGLRDNIDGHISFADVLYFTMITITTVGYGDIVPVTEGARLFDTFVVTPIRLFVWLIFLGTAYDFLCDASGTVAYEGDPAAIERSHDRHGLWNIGSEAVAEMLRRGADPATIVVIDERAAAIELANSWASTSCKATAAATRRWRRCRSRAPGRSSSPPGATTPPS